MDLSLLAFIIPGTIAVLGLAAWVGGLAQRVKSHDKTIENNRKKAEHDLERLHVENREDHRQIFSKLEEINQYIRNGKR